MLRSLVLVVCLVAAHFALGVAEDGVVSLQGLPRGTRALLTYICRGRKGTTVTSHSPACCQHSEAAAGPFRRRERRLRASMLRGDRTQANLVGILTLFTQCHTEDSTGDSTCCCPGVLPSHGDSLPPSQCVFTLRCVVLQAEARKASQRRCLHSRLKPAIRPRHQRNLGGTYSLYYTYEY